jgi:hypothetical protein
VTAEVDDPDREALFQATITAEPHVLAQCDALDLDILPSRSRASLHEGRASVKAILRLDQLVYLVSAGATVLLERLIDPRFPPDRILSSEQARARLDPLREARRRRAD